ncbi:hypothetical protein LTR86_007193 [Recurvomyces mirabilis]|nr:hypothetical protein LTR86_007193 [Recurvomyces mirabilis]
MLGDFGSAFLTTSDELENPDLYREDSNANGKDAWNGAVGFRAPETDPMFEVPEYHLDVEEKILSACNTWSIGRTMIAFMELKYGEGADGADFNFFSFEEEERSATVQQDAALQFYSHEVVKRVEQCCTYKPAERPTASELRDVAWTYIADNEIDVAYAGRNVMYVSDKYALGVPRDKLKSTGPMLAQRRSGVSMSGVITDHGRSPISALEDE